VWGLGTGLGGRERMYEIPYDMILMIMTLLSMISTSYTVACYFPVFTLF